MNPLQRLRSWLAPTTRDRPEDSDRPKGSDPTRCDGCDRHVVAEGMAFTPINGGLYCARCTEEITAD